jgi:hypothetical protein
VRKVTISLAVAVITFIGGLIAASVWIGRKVPELELPTSQSPPCNQRPDRRITDQVIIGDDGYFPEHAFYEDNEHDQLTRNRYARHLAQLGESSFLAAPRTQHVAYRFLWLRSFHSTIIVRVWMDGDRRMLTVKELSAQVANRESKVILNQTRSINEDEWINFSSLLNKTCLWDRPGTETGPIANDGEWWVLEGTSENHYHVITRQVPDDAYRELCLYMLKLSGISVELS